MFLEKLFKKEEIIKDSIILEKEKQNYTDLMLKINLYDPVDMFNHFFSNERSLFEKNPNLKPSHIWKIFFDKNKNLGIIIYNEYNDNVDFFAISNVCNVRGTILSNNPKLLAKIHRDNSIEIQDIPIMTHQSMGYGSALMESLIEFAKENHISKIFGYLSSVDARTEMDRIRRDSFYKKFGFETKNNLVVKSL